MADAPVARHEWEREGHRGRCLVCGLTYVDRPNPYAQQWLREWSRPNASGETIGRTPPCQRPPRCMRCLDKPRQCACRYKAAPERKEPTQ